MNWIDINKELPKTEYKYHSIPVLVYFRYGEQKIIHGAFYSKENYFHTDEGLPYDNITHWAYMPEPPKL